MWLPPALCCPFTITSPTFDGGAFLLGPTLGSAASSASMSTDSRHRHLVQIVPVAVRYCNFEPTNEET
jgi:hypothetical protein